MNNFSVVFIISFLGVTYMSKSCSASQTSNTRTGYSSRPNIIFIVADDAGWNDFSFHGSPQIPTPNLDALALSGVILNNYYASPLCTPTRGSILTGKHPIHISLQHFVISGGMEDGLPLNEKLMPQYLKELGYKTHLVGKWHLGNARRVYTPTYRGFDTYYGNWLGRLDHYGRFLKEGLGKGYDLRRNLEVDFEGIGNYTTDLYTMEAIKIIQNHPADRPLFLMINHMAPHAPNRPQLPQAPLENVNKFNDSISDELRRVYAGMVDRMDESVGEVIEALDLAGLLDNSIIVFTSDNGGSPEGYDNNYGSNWPLRGVKNSLWEGGTRVAGFIWSNILPQKVSMDLMHVQDWLPTLYEASGGNVSNLDDIDGVSQWKTFQKSDENSEVGVPTRSNFLYNIDDIYNNSAYRSGPWKVLQGNITSDDLSKGNWNGWYGPSGRSKDACVQDLIPKIMESKSGIALRGIGVSFDENKLKHQQREAEVRCVMPENPELCDSYYSPCLYNVIQDPCEFNNLAAEHPVILRDLLMEIRKLNQTALPPLRRYNYPEAAPKYWNNTWTNWKDYSEI